MEIVYDLLVVTHLLGMAGIISGVVARATTTAGPAGAITLYSAGAQVITGLALVGIASAGLVAADVNNTKVAVKLGVAVLVLVLAHVLWRRPQTSGKGLFATLAGLTVANVVIAVFW
ncbi:hypothetical protein SacmaDRAFT_5217 [Saccharomonospora marina XMU15]|uniref:Integral membrane protein n=1 Tax=Saccharomonospora marina XMU15 TaxID=882083 RepID=H5X546_9PSEU|nr:hypothetical protein [Saccharomonospora marina]EHR53378.1 hypothetical protein SacmaDRAFT_5217 [Saccharomonospora marina XMU15]